MLLNHTGVREHALWNIMCTCRNTRDCLVNNNYSN